METPNYDKPEFSIMSSALLSLLALALLGLGVRMTILLATRVPAEALATAQEHGRFAGLGSDHQDPGMGRPARSTGTPVAAPHWAAQLARI
jgi:hypothetical protein